jgi:hypothetical protein
LSFCLEHIHLIICYCSTIGHNYKVGFPLREDPFKDGLLDEKVSGAGDGLEGSGHPDVPFIIRADVVYVVVVWCPERMSVFFVMLHVVLVHAQVLLHNV